jgi:hypothetical protein
MDYVEKAVALAGDLDALRGYRANLRGRMQTSPLMDCNGFARGLESAFRSMWEKWRINGQVRARCATGGFWRVASSAELS